MREIRLSPDQGGAILEAIAAVGRPVTTAWIAAELQKGGDFFQQSQWPFVRVSENKVRAVLVHLWGRLYSGLTLRDIAGAWTVVPGDPGICEPAPQYPRYGVKKKPDARKCYAGELLLVGLADLHCPMTPSDIVQTLADANPEQVHNPS